MADVYVFISDGSEECEALLMVDLLRRAGFDLKTVAVKGEDQEHMGEKRIVSSHGISMECDLSIDQVPLPEEGPCAPCLFIPGGLQGVDNFKKSQILKKLLTRQMESDAYTVAVCAGPGLLGYFDLLQGRRATIYPGLEKNLGKGTYVKERIVVDGNLITGLGLGASIDLALATITALKSKEEAEKIGKKICYL